MTVALDCETWPITAEEPVPRLVSVAFSSDRGDALLHREEIAPDTIARAFASGVVMARGPYDTAVLVRQWPELIHPIADAYQAGRVHDVLTREKLIDHAHGTRSKQTPYNLGAVAGRRAGYEVDKDDPWRLRYGELDQMPIAHWPEGAKRYAIEDTRATWATYCAQESLAWCFPDEARQVRAHLALVWQEIRGMTTDLAMVDLLDGLWVARMHGHQQALIEAGLARYAGPKKDPKRKITKNEKAAREAAQAFADAHGKKIKQTKKGASLAEGELEKLGAPEGHPLHAYQQLGSLQTLRTGKIVPLRSPVVRTRYDECVVTGRTSSAEPGDPFVGTNLQNFPREVKKQLGAELLASIPKREIGVNATDGSVVKAGVGFRQCLVPRPGYVFVVVDWGMMELVCLAQTQYDWFGRSALGDALRAGRDPHEELGSVIAGFDLKGHPERKKWRTLAKAPNFGYPGGLGARKFVDWANGTYGEALRASGIEITEPFARQLKVTWRRTWPEMDAYHERIRAQPPCGFDMWQKPLYRMQLDRTGYVRGGMKYTEACNFPFQGLAAACAKDALFALWRACLDGGPLAGAHPVLFVHDENVLEVPVANCREYLPTIEQIMIRAVGRLCPDVPCTVESMVLARYTK